MAISLVQALRRRAVDEPERTAYTFLDADGVEVETLTWAGLDERARAVAAALQEARATGERALLLQPPGLGFIASFLGCLYAGTVAVPAYPPGRNRPPARLRSIAADARARVVLAPASITSNAAGLTDKAPELSGARWIATDELDPGLAWAWRETEPAPDETAFLQYTSGSTSDPKGVVVTHGSLVDNEEAIRRAFGMSEASVVVGWLPLYHDMGLIGNVLQPLWAGARAILMAPLSFLQRPVLWLETVSRYRATTSGGPDFAYGLCARKVSEEEKAGLDLSSWRVAFNGAEPVRAGTIERFVAAFAACGFRREAFFPCYGLAEATLFVTGGALGVPGSGSLVSSGRVESGQRVEIVDPEALTLCAPGEVGEIWVAGSSVAAGYWGRPEETQRTFDARTAGGEGPFLRTGDLGFLTDGELFVNGRIKDLIILRGRNYYPQDLEWTAEASHPALRPGCCAAFSIEREGEERLVILQEVDRSRASDADAVAETVRRAVAAEHEVAVEEVVLLRSGTILKTTSGKIRRAACRAAYLEGELAVVARTGVEPSRRNAENLAAEVARVLRREGVDPDVPLIALGLDSLAATELRSTVEERTGVEIPLAFLLEGASLRALEARIGARAGAGPARASMPGLREKSPLKGTQEEGDAPGEHPLSEGQRALWFVDRLDPAAAALHLAGAARVRGGLDVDALRGALVRLTERHPALRTTFEDEPVRRVHAEMEPDFAVGNAEEATLPHLLTEEAYRPFELERGPLLRVRVWNLSAGDAVLLVAIHHLIADFASMAVLLRGLVEPGEAPAGSGYTAWIRRQEEALAGPRGERLRAWWHERLAGELPILDLPADHPRPANRSWRGHVHTLRLEGVAEALRSLQGGTLYSKILAGLQAVLHRWTGQDEALVGAATAGRRAGLEGEIGYFVNPVALRLGMKGEPSFSELAARAGAVAVEAFEHGEYPFPRLARELRLDRDAGRSILRAVLVLQPARSPEERALAPFALGEAGARTNLGDLALESIALPEIRTQFDLLLMAAETGDGGLALSLQLDADLFDAATAERLLEHLGSFLRAAAADPGRPVSEIEILSEAERAQLSAWGIGTHVEPADRCLHDLIAEQVERTPGATALVHGDEQLTYRELQDRAGRLADHLRGLGVGPEVRVGVCSSRTPEMVVGLLAVLEAGGAYMPLDPSYPSDRLAYLVADSGAALVLVDGRGEERLPASEVPRVRLDGTLEPIHAPPSRKPSPENLAYLIYTSGSTGRPKAVAIEHRNVVALARWCREAFTDRELDGVLASTSIGFDMSVFELFVPLCWGGRVVLTGSALDLPEVPASAGVRLLDTVPSAAAELLRAGSLPPWIETVNLGGEPVRRELARGLFDAGVRRVVNLYGPSEDTTFTTFADLKRDGEGDTPIGRPVGGAILRVLTPQISRMRLVPRGAVGELFLGGMGLSRGYLGRPDLTAERFIPSSFPEDGPGARLYRTGDRVRWRPDGELAFLGRVDHQVKIRGFRVEPGEIEAVLASHPEIQDAAVLAMGEEAERRLVAYVASSHPLDLRSWLEDRLPEYMIPSAFVFLKTLPLNPNGKVDRRALAEMAPGAEARPGYEPPRTPVEAELTDIWAEILGIGKVGVHDDFFDLGGHSLLAVRVQARIRERLGVDVPLPSLFDASTVASLARVVAKAPPWETDPPASRPRDGSPLPLSFAQERMWLLHRLDPDSPAYHVAAEVRVAGSLDVAALAGALWDLTRCHEVLRTRFPEVGGGPVQIVGTAAPPGLPVICLSALPSTQRLAEAERLAREEARRPFDLAAAPPVRASLLRLEQDDHRLLLTFHHVAADEASLGILARDLGASYEALSQGRPSPLAPPPLQMADVAVWQRERLWGAALETRLAWWEERLAGVPPLDLPADRPWPPAASSRGGSVSLPLPQEVAADLASLGRESGATLFMVLLAGFQAFLSRLSGAEDFATGSPFANRDHRDLEGVVGPLLNTLALRADLAGDPSFRELLGRVRRATVAAHERADLPFDLLVERLRPGRSLGSSPLFEVIFALQRPPGSLRAGGVVLEPRPVFTGTAKADLTLFALERETGIEFELEYAADRWDRSTAARLLDRLAGLLAAAGADPGLRLSELPALDGPERRAVLAPEPAVRPIAEAPRTPVEELLAGIWEDVLGIERPGLHDDFFELGGQSLLAARVVSRLRNVLGVDLPLRALFEDRTLAGLAARVEAERNAGDVQGPPLVPVPRDDFPAGMPLSFGQERLWFIDRLDPGSPVYNMPAAVSLSGSLDPRVLREAIAGIAARHEVLRAAFRAPGGTPVQIAPGLDLDLPRVDLSALAEPWAEALLLAETEALRPFDLEAGPPLRTTLLRLDEATHVLLVTVHHIAFDGWSVGIFLRELAALYGKEALPALPVQYADFAVWQRQRLEGSALEPHLAWWRETLAGAPPLLALPLDRPRPPVQTFRGGSRRLALRPETARAVRDLSRRLEATSFMTLLAAWTALLARYNGGSDLVVGTAVAGRGRVELEPLIGLFAENLVLRLDLGGDPAFGQLVVRARETTLAAWAHQDVPFERLVRELRPDRDLSHSPLYQTALTLDASERPPLELPGLWMELLPVPGGTAKLDLALYLEDRQGTVSGMLEYNRDLFDAATAVRLLAAFERLVEAVIRSPEHRVSELPVLSEAERHQVLRELSGGYVAPGTLVPQLIEAWAARAPEAPAVSGDGRTLSYDDLDLQAGRLARRLLELGVDLEVRVAVCLPRVPEMIVALLGIWKAGGVYVPLDPTHPEDRLAWLVEDSRAAVVLASRQGPAPPPGVSVLFLEDLPELPEDTAPAAPLFPPFPETAAYLVYTSGSTGRPKGVVVPHGSLALYAASVAGLYKVRPGDRVLQAASVAFDLSLDEILPSLTGGAELVLRDDAMLSSVSAFLEGCRERGITTLILATAYWHEIAARLEAEDLALPPSLRMVSTGGERLLPEWLAVWRRRFPSGPLFNTYGPTEAIIQVTGMDLNVPEMASRPDVPIGRPLPGAGVWLLNPHGEPVPPGVSGEACLGGSLARGYLDQPDRTAERFVPHPFAATPGDRLYRTGDLARFLPDGTLEFAGRIDTQVKVRGYRVEPGEVEAVLVRHPGVEAAAVVAWDDPRGQKRLAGYVVPRVPIPAAAELRAFLSGSLPEPLVPSELIFLTALPMTPHGKLDRNALPAPSGHHTEAKYVPPRDEAERRIAAIWRETLEIEKVGAHDNFFDLGGHSLALARVHVLLKERLGREVSMVDLFRYPTVGALAKHLALPVTAQVEKPALAMARSRTTTRQGRFLEARKRMAPLPGTAGVPAGPTPRAAFLRFVERNPEALERASFTELEHHGVGSPYPLQPWPALVDKARVAEMERVSTGIARLIKSLPRRVFDNDPERLRDFYGLGSAELARLMVQPPDGLAAAIGRGDFLDTSEGLKCLEFNMLSALGGWEAPLWAEAYLRVPLFARFLREERLRVACRDTVSLLLAHAVAEARELGTAGEVNVALVTPEQAAGAHGQHLEGWVAGRYAEALRREAPGASGSVVVVPYTGLRERAGALWAGDRRVHAAVELHDEGTAAQALRCFRAGNLKLFNAPIRAVLTDKRNLALLSELAGKGNVLNPAERELVTRHVPWTRRLAASQALRRGHEVWLPELALKSREELVIKKARAGRGSAVYLGAATPEALWRERVERALAEGDWIVQEQVEPLPYVHQLGERGSAPHDVVWGLFALGDRYGGGFLSLAPSEARTRMEGGVVNIMRGATVGVIFEVLKHE